jgi:hypothetical protein
MLHPKIDGNRYVHHRHCRASGWGWRSRPQSYPQLLPPFRQSISGFDENLLSHTSDGCKKLQKF